MQFPNHLTDGLRSLKNQSIPQSLGSNEQWLEYNDYIFCIGWVRGFPQKEFKQEISLN